jgi:CheY-like chemotaxis protein
VNVAEAFREAAELVRPLADRGGVRLLAGLAAADGCHVRADKQKLKQVLLNLLSNAVKFNRDGGEVRLACEELAHDRVRLAVSDTGVGIPADKLGRLFIPFDRLGAEQTDVEGSGLGLALSKHLVELMGGTLTVTTVPGQGSRFCVELPRADDPQRRLPAAQPPAPEAVVPATDHRTVLYVEDNLDNLRLVQRILEHRPWVRLFTATRGGLALDLARQHRPDLILLDVHLPDLSGSQLLRELQAATETRSIPVVVVSADATPRQIERLRAAGAREYLTKPIDVARFLEIVDQVLEEEPAQCP